MAVNSVVVSIICFGVFYLLQTVISSNAIGNYPSPGNLTLVQIIHRHGERTPEKSFPNDPNLDKLIELGFGELTNVGKQEQYGFGRFLRNRYKDFASQRYKRTHTKCKSSDYDRTIMSAYCVLTGMYPPFGDQIWHENITWQPVPVHMVPAPVDYMLVINKNCERRKNITDTARAPLNRRNKDFYGFLSNMTGMAVTDADNVRIIFEAIEFAYKMNWSIPSWASNAVMAKMEQIAINGFQIMFPDKLSQKLASGRLLKEIVDNMENKTVFQELDGRQMNTYTTHDTVVYGFLSLLDLYNGIKPPLNSAIVIELYLDVNSTYWVQILYRNNSDVEPHVLKLPNCSAPCLWDEFLNITSHLIPVNIIEECKLHKLSVDTWDQNVRGSNAVLAILIGTAIATIVIFAYKVQKNRKRSEYARI